MTWNAGACIVLALGALLGITGCGAGEDAGEATSSESAARDEGAAGRRAPRPVVERPDLRRRFDEAGVSGVFVLQDARSGRTLASDLGRARKPFPPASTFKIPNSLIALDSGVASGPGLRIAWDPARDPPRSWWPPDWAADQTMRTALPSSVVWYYQELARRTGPRLMQRYLKRFAYGNRDISGGIDRFWLTGGLRISPLEQVRFLRRFHAGELGVSARATRIVKSLLALERGGGCRLSGKTGWYRPERGSGRQVGWLVGWLECGRDVHLFATNLDIEDDRDATSRLPITRAILGDLGLLDGPRGATAPGAGDALVPLASQG